MLKINIDLLNNGPEIADLDLCKVILVNNAYFPWLILIPKRTECTEIIDLIPIDRAQLIEEIALISTILQEEFGPDKLNCANIGNIIPQLHIHIVARYKSDACWPAPVFGHSSIPYDQIHLENLAKKLGKAIKTKLS